MRFLTATVCLRACDLNFSKISVASMRMHVLWRNIITLYTLDYLFAQTMCSEFHYPIKVSTVFPDALYKLHHAAELYLFQFSSRLLQSTPASNGRIWRCTFQHALALARTQPLISARRDDIEGGVLVRTRVDSAVPMLCYFLKGEDNSV